MSVTLTGMDYIRANFGVTTQPKTVALAVHEATHAVVALAMGAPVEWVTIVPGEDNVGHCYALLEASRHLDAKERGEQLAHRELRFFIAGVESDRLLDSAIRAEGTRKLSSASDKKNIREALDAMGLTTDAQRKTATDKATAYVHSVFTKYSSEIDRLAGALLVHKTLHGMAAIRRFCPLASAVVDEQAAMDSHIDRLKAA